MRHLLFSLLLIVSVPLVAQEVIPLYKGVIPNSLPYAMKEADMTNENGFVGYRNVSKPSLTIYLPPADKATGNAVIICPGGGYSWESFRMEGTDIAKSFVKHGIAAFVLKYRLPSDSIMKDKSIGPLQDAQQAIKTVRQRAVEWNVAPDKIAIMGFSAGGHLASTAATHFDQSYIDDEILACVPTF